MFQPGDRVFAKMKGFPFWPARVDPLPPHVELPKGKVPVFFYGTHQVSFLNPKNLVSFDDHKDAYGKRKVLIKAMIEIESDPEILLLGKDPAAEAFWESLYPLEYGKVEREADTIRGRMSRSNSPATKRALKRKASRAPRVHSAKRQRSGDQEDDLISISPISDTVDTNSLQAAEVMGEKKDNRQEKEEDNLQASESVNKRTARKRHHLAVECYDPIENDKRVKEAKLDACFETEKAVVLMEKGGIIGAGSEIDQFGSPEEMAGVMSAEAPSNVFGNIVMLDTVNTQSEEPCNTPESVNVDVEETQELTSFDTTALSSVNEEGYYDITEIVQDSEATENQKSQRNMREGKPRRFVVDLDAESEDEKKYFRRCSRSDDDDEEEEDLDDDYADDDDDYGCVQKPKKSDKQSMYNIKKEEEEEVICNAYRGMKNELASGSEAVDEPIKHSSSSSSERETVSKSSKSGDDEDSYDCKLKGGDISQDRVVEGDDEYICKNNESVDNELMDVSKHLSELRRHSSSEGEASSKSSGNDDFGESVAQNVKSGESAIEEDRERIRRNWGSEDENRVVRSTKSLDLRRKGGAEGDCISRSFVSGGEVRKKASDSEEDSERVRENLDSWASESPDTFKNIGDHRRPDNDGKDESSRRCSLKNSPRHKAKVPGSADGHSRTKRRGSSGEVELVKRAKHVSSSSSGVAPSGVDKLQILHDLTIQLKSNLVRGHEKFDAAVDVLARICATKVSLLQLTKVWELTDCVKKCRKYRLSAQVRDAASRALAYFQRIQAAASKEEVLKAKAIVAERMRLEKSEKPQPPAAAPVATSTAPSVSNAESPPTNSSPEQQQEKKFSLEALRAELDAKADLVLARLAATEARLMADRNKTTSTPMPSSSSSTAASAVSSSRRRTEETAKDVLSRVDEVASRLGVNSGAVPPPPPPPPPPRFVRPQQVDLDTRISQLMMGVITPASRPPPHAQPQSSSPQPQPAASAKLLALREQIQRKRRSAATAAASTIEPHKEAVEKTADDDIYDLLGV